MNKKYSCKIFYERNSICHGDSSKIDWFGWIDVDIAPDLDDVKAFIKCFIKSATGNKISIELTLKP